MSSAKLSFLGASGEVTGSSYRIESNGSVVLVDCGMFQGPDSDKRNAEPFAFSPSELNAVLVTHAHIDHSGRLPLLVKQGFKGEIWCTNPTAELLEVLLHDTAKLAAEDAEWKSRKNARRGLPPVRPLFTDADVRETIKRLRTAVYDEVVSCSANVRARFRDAGHIVGAAIVEVWVSGDEGETKIVFSGDIGPANTVIENPPTMIEEADYVIIESTYGDRAHKGLAETREEFRTEIGRAIAERAKILVPTFVVDRAQRVLYELLLLQESGAVAKFPPIYFDSPMGEKTTKIYEKYVSLLSPEIRAMSRAGRNPFEPAGLFYTSGIEESRAINEVAHAMVLAGSGMCSGGRIVHHLKHNVWQRNCHVFFVGFQAGGTLGRKLVNGEKTLRIAGEDVAVAARVHTIGGFSAHGDRNDLLYWASRFPKKTVFFVTHGERKSSDALAFALRDMGYEASSPQTGDRVDLIDRHAAIQSAPLTTFRPSEERLRIQALLQEIVSETQAIGEDIDSVRDYAQIADLLESSRLILRSVRAMK